MLTDFQNFCTTRKRLKCATKCIQRYPLHLRHVAALPWEIKKCKFSAGIQHNGKNANIFIASTFVIHPQISIFSVFKIASFPPYWLQIKFSISLFVYLFTFAIKSRFPTSEREKYFGVASGSTDRVPYELRWIAWLHVSFSPQLFRSRAGRLYR